MRRIATHTAIDQLNAARRRQWIRTAVGRVLSRGGEAWRDGPAGFELTDSVRRAFEKLPPKLRVVATLALVEELPQAEIADALGIPVGTVKSRLFRATRELRRELRSASAKATADPP
jgi:RNA polymerase sigma-70 factor (ECF subfamily)